MSQVAADDGIDHSMTENSPTSYAVLLGYELRALRERTGLNQRKFAQKLGTHTSNVNRYELARRHPPEPTLRLWLTLCGVKDEHDVDDFVQRFQQARTPDWWADHRDDVPTWFERYAGLEAAAVAKCTYEAELVPGLLQVRRYTEAVAACVRRAAPAGSSENLASVRDSRKRRLTGPDPLVFTAVLNEAVLRRPVGGADVMREQLEHLADMARRDNVTLHVLPFEAQEHPAMTGTFTMLQFRKEQINTVYIEHPNGATYVDRPQDVHRYGATFRHLVDLALSEAETITMIERSGREFDERSVGVAQSPPQRR